MYPHSSSDLIHIDHGRVATTTSSSKWRISQRSTVGSYAADQLRDLLPTLISPQQPAVPPPSNTTCHVPIARNPNTNEISRRNQKIFKRHMSFMPINVLPTILLILLLLQTQTSLSTVQSASYSVTLNAKDTDCYVFRVPQKPVTISGNYDCYEEGNNFVRNCRKLQVWIETIPVRNEHRQQEHHHHHHDTVNPYVWESQADASEDIFHVPINQNPEKELKTKYQLCFETSSKDDDQVEEREEDDNIPNSIRVGFHLRVENIVAPRTLPDNELGPDEQRALHVIDTADTTVESWHHLLDHFDYMRNREAIQDQLMRQTSNKVIGWSVVEAVVVITMAIAQVCYWKSFFEQRRYM